MCYFTRVFGLILLGLWLATSSAAPISATPQDTYEYQLKNGMRVIFRRDTRSPTVAQMVWYRAGSIDEFNGTTGVAHALEHMMFKGTKTVKPGDFSRQVAALGGQENAFTSNDYTAYFQQVGKSHLPTIMRLEADRMTNLLLSKTEFDKEIQVVMEERRLRTEDQASALLYEQLLATAFVTSPRRVQPIGWMDDLKAMNYLDVQQWYQRWYAPNNAVLVIAGDAQPEQVYALAEKYFGGIAARPLPLRKPQHEPVQRGLRIVEVKAPAENPQLAMAYKVPILIDPKKDEESYALMVLDVVLSGHTNSRLQRNLVRDQRLADEMGTSYMPISRGPELFYFWGVPAQGKTLAQLEDAVRAELATLAKTGVSEAELARVKAQLVAKKVFKRDSVFGQAMEIGMAQMSGVSWRDFDLMLEKIYAVTSAQVQAVITRYFTDDQLTIARLLPLPVDTHAAPKGKTLPNELLH
ncbi:MAG: insulinase family protein [Ottowia sp.]|nr:insulinase family protein [Ottowia sp.]